MVWHDIGPKERFCSVMTFSTSHDSLEAAKLHHNLGLCLAGVSELIAVEASYHRRCLSAFQSSTSKTKQDSENENEKNENEDLPVKWLCTELKYVAAKGRVLQQSDVWDC